MAEAQQAQAVRRRHKPPVSDTTGPINPLVTLIMILMLIDPDVE